MVTSKTKILITGAVGSIGSALAMRVYQKKPPKELILVDQDETGIFYISSVMRGAHCLVGDVTRKDRMEKIFAKYKPDIVYHCAAYKHVHVMELQKEEAIENNIFGTKNIIDLSNEYGAKKFVLLSTDKAVNPSSVMGSTKRVCEQLCLSQDTKCKFVIVRFGNVIRSRGSVIEIFEKAISEGKVLEITHPGMERYFITMQNAVDLLLEASKGKNRQLYIWDMDKPRKIVDVAEELCKEHKVSPGIRFTGLRPGEKLSEELFYPWEKLIPKGKYSIANLDHEEIDLNKLISEI